MDQLQAAITSRPHILPLLQEAALLQACAHCCLRLAAVREAAAYGGSALPPTAAGLLRCVLLRLGGPQVPEEAIQEQPVGVTAAHPVALPAAAAASAPAAAADGGDGSKRRKLDPAGSQANGSKDEDGRMQVDGVQQSQSAEAAASQEGALTALAEPQLAAATAAAAAAEAAVAAVAVAAAAAAASAAHKQVEGEKEGLQAEVVCPLCLGLLQTDAAASSSSCGGGGGTGGSRVSCAFQLASTVSSLNDASRYATGAPAPAAAAEAAADPSGLVAPVIQQRVAAVASLAATAAGIAAEFEFDSFALEVSLPAPLAVRQQALSWRLRQPGQQQQEKQQQEQQQQQQEGAAAALGAAVDVREAVRLQYRTALSAALGKPHDSQAQLRISLTVSHPDADAEGGWLAASSGEAGGGGGWQQRGKRRQNRQQKQQQQQQQQQQQPGDVPTFSDTTVQRLGAMSRADFLVGCPATAAQLAPPAVPATVQLRARRQPLLVGGRYLKLRRGIPQSPWFIDAQRKGEGSVQETIERAVLPAFQADSYTFVAAGREDIDVRMLGAGRPFILEVQNARRAMPPPDQLRRLGDTAAEASGGGVALRGLFASCAAQLSELKDGEQEKQKSYVAVCWLPRPLTDADVALLESTADLEVQQQTPIRVLHRRANLARPKLIHEMRAVRLPGQPPQYFLLHLRTAAGTYVKEFVHGDQGRSRPSLGDLLGCQAQIVSLDVGEIHMQFEQQQHQ